MPSEVAFDRSGLDAASATAAIHSLPIVLTLHTMTNLTAGVFPLLRPESASSE